MTTEHHIPLNLLVPSKANVRRTGKTDGIAELAASIAAHGLRQNLNVRPSADGERFEVVAGGRRLRALKHLAKAGHMAEDAPISCLVLQEGEDASEISLAENAVRAAMHPDDQFEAFRTLIEKNGASVEDVAARFGVTPAVVKQRLKLANVSPTLRALFRKGEMALDHVMALAISDDHAAQEAAWESLPEWNRDPATLKDALTESAIPVNDKLAKFVGIEGYIEAGGAIVRDLFDDSHEGYLSDRALVLRLAEARLEREAEAVRAEGWKWVKLEAVRDYSVRYDRLPPGRVSAKNKARAGVILRIGHDGDLQAERGLIDPADVKAEAKAARAAERAANGEAAAPSGFSAALTTDLTAHRTAALRLELARRPDIALAVTVHALASGILYGSEAASCLALHGESEDLTRHVRVTTDSPAHHALSGEGERWGDRLPGDAADLLAWCLAQPQGVLLDLLAYLAALTVDAVQVKGRTAKHDHADRLAAALSLDMAQHWTPSTEGFYARLPKAALMHSVSEAKVKAVSFGGAKKAEAAMLAENALRGSGWLPEALRLPA